MPHALRPYAERLVEPRRVVQQRRVSGRREAEVVPLERRRTTRGRSPNSSSSACSSVAWMAFQPISGPSGARKALAAGGLREQLPAEADAEHRHLAAQRLLDHRALERQPRDGSRPRRGSRCRRARSGRRRPRAGAPAPACSLENQISISAPAARSGASSASSPESSSCCRARMRIGGNRTVTARRACRLAAPSRRPARQPGQDGAVRHQDLDRAGAHAAATRSTNRQPVETSPSTAMRAPRGASAAGAATACHGTRSSSRASRNRSW